MFALTFRGNATTAEFTSQGWIKGPTITNGTTCQTEIWYRIAGSGEGTAGAQFTVSASVLFSVSQVEITGFTGTPTLDRTGTAIGTTVGSVTTAVSATITAASEFVFGCAGDREGATSGLTWTATPTPGGGATGAAGIDATNPPKNGEGLIDGWATSGASGTLPSLQYFLSANTNTTWACCIATFQGVVSAVNPFKHSAGYMVVGGSKRLRRRATGLYSLETRVWPVLTVAVPPTRPGAAYFQTGTRRPARRRVGFWHTIAQAVNTSWTGIPAPQVPTGEALIMAFTRRLRRRASSSLTTYQQTNAQLVSDSQISLSGQAGWRAVATTPARPNPPNLLLSLLVAVVAIPFKHSAGVLIQVFKWGRRISRRMAYWPIWVQQSRPLLTPDSPETKPALVMVQWAPRRPRRRMGVAHQLGNQVNTVYVASAAPLTPQSEALVTASAKRLRRRAPSSVTVYQNSTTILN